MKKIVLGTTLAVGIGAGLFIGQSALADSPLYRMYNPNSGEHFYTQSASEKNGLANLGWHEEGIAWFTPDKGDLVYRLYNPNEGDHFYTSNVGEAKWLHGLGWNDEGKAFYSVSQDVKNRQPVLRAYNKNAKVGAHNYTVNANEQNFLMRQGWTDEKVAFYGVDISADKSKAQLVAKVNEVKALDPEKYTTDSWAYVDVSLKQAQRTLTDPNATQHDYDYMVKDLTTYTGKLVERANKFALKGALERYDAYSKLSEVTSNQNWPAVEALIPKARTIFDDANVTQAQVNAINDQLNDALSATRNEF